MSAVMAGYCLIRYYANTTGNLLVVPYLLAAGALLAMADAGWRLIFNAAAENERIPDDQPSSALSPTWAYLITVFTTLAGLMCAMTGGYNSFRAGGAMIVLMLARSALFRTTEVVAPMLRGLTSGMLFVIGMTAHPSFAEMFYIDETLIPTLFFTIYMVVVAVLAQVRDSARPREAPAGEKLSNETASRLLEMRDETVDRSVVWFAGAALILVPLVMAWVLPWRWLSWTLLIFLAVTTMFRLIPVLAYRTRRDLADFVEAMYRGGALLNAGAVASQGTYHMKEIAADWIIPMPGREQLAAVAFIALLAMPAWVLRRAAPVD